MDKISIKGLRLFAYHGVNPEEKENGQTFVIDMDYYVNFCLDTRETLYFKRGIDIWRVLQLAKLDDKQAQNKENEIDNIST